MNSVTPPLPSRFVNGAAAALAYGDAAIRLGGFLMRTDPLADRVVEWIAEQPKGVGWEMISRATTLGIQRVQDAPAPLREFFQSVETTPTWVDWKTIERGGELLLRSGALGGIVLGARSLVMGYASPGGNKPLALTGRLEEQAPRRLNETARFVHAVSVKGGMRPFAEGNRITIKVRLMHAQVRRMLLKSDKWHTEKWGIPINQHDMVATTLLFSKTVIDGLRILGMNISRDEAEDSLHLWKYVGYLIGVEEELLPATEREATRVADIILATQGDPDEDSKALTRALLRSPVEEQGDNPNARRQVQLGIVMCRELVGDHLADAMGVERSAWKHAVPVARRLVHSVDRFAKNIPFARKRAIDFGISYWMDVIQRSPGDATFSLPTTLRKG